MSKKPASPEVERPAFTDSHSFDLYLRRLRWALSALPENDRDEIVAETLSLLLDSLGGSATYDEAVSRLGEPEDYARGYLESYEISATLGSGSPWRMLALASRLAGRSFAAFVSVLGLFIGYSFAISLTALAILKPIFPTEVGMWIDRDSGTFALGYLPDPSPYAQELLGLWLIPFCLTAGLGLLRVCSVLARRFLASWRQS